VPQPTVFFRRRLLERFGVLDKRYHFIFDFELCVVRRLANPEALSFGSFLSPAARQRRRVEPPATVPAPADAATASKLLDHLK
jgi:hypothetical protein